MKNNQKGITLIALVVTIIVLLILAGVSIAMIAGEGGILSNAKASAAQSKLMNKADEISLQASEKATDYFKEKYTQGEGSTYAEKNSVDEVVKEYLTSLQSSLTSEGFTLEGNDIKTGYTLKYNGYSTVGKVVGDSGRLTWSEPTKIST